jgi:hypothetical protein
VVTIGARATVPIIINANVLKELGICESGRPENYAAETINMHSTDTPM